ncbi:hypothetical protein [Brevundimonas sp.]
MSKSLRPSDEKHDALSKALDGFERKVTPPASEPWPALRQRSNVELGPKTQLALRLMAWIFGIFWALWVILALIVTPPRQISDLGAIPFSALVCWLLFQFHKTILVASVRKRSGPR